MILGLAAFGLGGTARADCPAPADSSAELQNLIALAQAAENVSDGQRASNEMWQVWLRAPDAAA